MAEMLSLAALVADPDRCYLIDVRDAEDFAEAHVAGAMHVPLEVLASYVNEIPADRTPVTICGKGGGRSAQGAELLKTAGHTGALWLEGGTNGWLAQIKQAD